MYEEIEQHAAAFNNLRKLLADPQGATRTAEICRGLDAAAQKIADTQAGNEDERGNLNKLYRGFVAASRIVSHLQEQQAMRI